MIEGNKNEIFKYGYGYNTGGNKKSIDKNEPVFFSCDIEQFLLNKNNILDTEIYKMEEILNINFNLNKKERLLCYESKPTHLSMVITGYNIKFNYK